MQFAFLGISYQNTELEVREKAAFTDQKMMDFFHEAEQSGVRQCMILSTCNRSEVFYFWKEEEQKGQMIQIYKKMFPEAELEAYIRQNQGEEAVFYLFRVAAGLESMVAGEDQILGQVKHALEFSRMMGACGKELDKVVRDAVTCAKKIKSKLKISEKPLSVGYIGIQRLNEACPIKGKKVLVIGSGNTAALALKYLREYKAGEIFVCSRTYAHAGKLQEQIKDLRIVPYQERYQVMRECDIVVSATSAPHLVVRRSEFWPEKPVAFLDLAAPRDIDPVYDTCPDAVLIHLDTLREISRHNQEERMRLLKDSEQWIAEAGNETMHWLQVSRMDPTIRSLQERCREIAEDSYAYLSRKMDLSGREKRLLQKVLNASLQRLIKEPVQHLKHLEDQKEQDAYKEIVHQLFQFEAKEKDL
ncbi:MAG TPA: glutamyl-tRNA reductase [Candidatus Anaerostipes avistercoris]|uniref:Glutamyl-tRNA reductase n=1 Tax=Candidatus Anaerostipes avistercoris TaxID=2838462 RepID=A0A9D2T8S4_9FIRM|nr:glutamyl-tRNA reductase [Candidatus Anaerostipes avistercoris]